MGETALEFHPVTADRWEDLEALFGPRGACAGCWCMYFRQTGGQFSAMRGEQNRLAMKALVESCQPNRAGESGDPGRPGEPGRPGRAPGILAYADGRPVGWVSVAPREEFVRLQRSRILKPVDDQPVWSVVCFFVSRGFRGRNLTVGLLKAAVKYVREHGGRIIEGYPADPKSRYPDAYAYVGLASTFAKAGFTEVARPSESRVIMRYEL